MKHVVLDSYALIAFLEQEPGFDVVAGVFEQCVSGETRALMSIVNWGEVYYHALRVGGEKTASLALTTMRALPLEIAGINEALTLQAARYKAFHKMSYADAFAAALTKLRKAELVTGDNEFRALAKDIKVLWL